MNASELMTSATPVSMVADRKPLRESVMSSSTLVVMEHGSPWPAQLDEFAHECVVLKQEHNELAFELLGRTCERVRAREQMQHSTVLAVLSCNEETTKSAFAERIALSRILLSSVLAANGCLLLVARPSAPASLRHALLALAGTLTETLAGTSVSVRVVFDGHREIRNRKTANSTAAVFA